MTEENPTTPQSGTGRRSRQGASPPAGGQPATADTEQQAGTEGTTGTAVAERDLQADTPEGVTEDENTGLMVPEGNAPGPEPLTNPTIAVADTREFIPKADRGTYIGDVQARDNTVEVPDDFHLLADAELGESVEVDGEPVEFFQVVGSTGALALRLNGATHIFNPEQTKALAREVRAVSTNVVT